MQLALVCFRLKGSDELNQKLLSTINASGKLHMVPASVNEQFVIRFCVVAQNARDDDIGKNRICTLPICKNVIIIIVDIVLKLHSSYISLLDYAWKTIAKIATDVIEKMELLVSITCELEALVLYIYILGCL